MIKILFVCHGNICRSTMAESVMTYLVKQAGLSDQFYINSAATSREEWKAPRRLISESLSDQTLDKIHNHST